jgi:hypothetical protein
MLHHGVPPPPPSPEPSSPTSDDDGKYEDMEDVVEEENSEEEEKFVPPPTGPLQATLSGSFETSFKEKNTRTVCRRPQADKHGHHWPHWRYLSEVLREEGDR